MAGLYPQNIRKQETLNLFEVIIEELETQKQDTKKQEAHLKEKIIQQNLPLKKTWQIHNQNFKQLS